VETVRAALLVEYEGARVAPWVERGPGWVRVAMPAAPRWAAVGLLAALSLLWTMVNLLGVGAALVRWTVVPPPPRAIDAVVALASASVLLAVLLVLVSTSYVRRGRLPRVIEIADGIISYPAGAQIAWTTRRRPVAKVRRIVVREIRTFWGSCWVDLRITFRPLGGAWCLFRAGPGLAAEIEGALSEAMRTGTQTGTEPAAKAAKAA
jgi:hypothetical protein